MPRKLRISVPEPCTQQWNDMSLVDDSRRHCASCNKLIFDFTKMSDAELIAYFNRNTVSCGKFAPHQLDRTIVAPKKTNRSWISTLLLPALMGLSDAAAQQKTAEPIPVVADSSQLNVEIPITALPVLDDTVIVQGRVLEKTDSLKDAPMPGAVVVIHLKDGTKKGGVCDVQGNFQIHLDSAYAGDSVDVSVSMTGYEPYHTTIVLLKEVTLSPVIIQGRMHGYSTTIGELIQPHPVRSKGRRFFWRLFHPRSWLR